MNVKLAMLLPAIPDRRWDLAAQVGVPYAVSRLGDAYEPWKIESLQKAINNFTQYGFKLHALEGDQFDMSRIKLGLTGRDEDIERYIMMLECMGQTGIKIICYNFMAGIGWYRNNTTLKERGGALSSSFEPDKIEKMPLKLTHEELWNNYEYFIKAVLPTAEKFGVKMGLHPDDPPVDKLLGFPRIFNSVAAYERMLTLTNSPSSCITLCIANFQEMGADDLELFEKWQEKIIFTHLRSNRSLPNGGFVETFHDNGPIDMVERFKKLKSLGLNDILIRPDHAPTMAGEDNSEPGYAAMGRIFAIGYFKGIMRSIGVDYE